jgi:hypothetical protein
MREKKPLHVILNKSKLAYRIYVILIANRQLNCFAAVQAMDYGHLYVLWALAEIGHAVAWWLRHYATGRKVAGLRLYE